MFKRIPSFRIKIILFTFISLIIGYGVNMSIGLKIILKFNEEASTKIKDDLINANTEYLKNYIELTSQQETGGKVT